MAINYVKLAALPGMTTPTASDKFLVESGTTSKFITYTDLKQSVQRDIEVETAFKKYDGTIAQMSAQSADYLRTVAPSANLLKLCYDDVKSAISSSGSTYVPINGSSMVTVSTPLKLSNINNQSAVITPVDITASMNEANNQIACAGKVRKYVEGRLAGFVSGIFVNCERDFDDAHTAKATISNKWAYAYRVPANAFVSVRLHSSSNIENPMLLCMCCNSESTNTRVTTVNGFGTSKNDKAALNEYLVNNVQSHILAYNPYKSKCHVFPFIPCKGGAGDAAGGADATSLLIVVNPKTSGSASGVHFSGIDTGNNGKMGTIYAEFVVVTGA